MPHSYFLHRTRLFTTHTWTFITSWKPNRNRWACVTLQFKLFSFIFPPYRQWFIGSTYSVYLNLPHVDDVVFSRICWLSILHFSFSFSLFLLRFCCTLLLLFCSFLPTEYSLFFLFIFLNLHWSERYWVRVPEWTSTLRCMFAQLTSPK